MSSCPGRNSADGGFSLEVGRDVRDQRRLLGVDRLRLGDKDVLRIVDELLERRRRLDHREAVKAFLRQAGVGDSDVALNDGSGLSRNDLISANTTVQLLTFMSRLGALLARGAFDALRERIDPRKHNGGVFLGLNGIVVKSHGGTDALGFAAAIDVAVEMARNDLVAKIAADVAEMNRHIGESRSQQAVEA